MKKFLLINTILFIIELFITFSILVFYQSLDFGSSFDATCLYNFWRLMFFGIPYLITYSLINKWIVNINFFKPFVYSFFNLIIFLILVLLSKLIWGENVPLPPKGIMFWVTCVSIFLAPMVMIILPLKIKKSLDI